MFVDVLDHVIGESDRTTDLVGDLFDASNDRTDEPISAWTLGVCPS
jgi:hypothetical protein